MPMPNCSPCCSSEGCTNCVDGQAPAELEAVLAGVVDKAPEPATPCANCAGTNDTYLLAYGGVSGTGECCWGYTVDPFDTPTPCFAQLTLCINKGFVGSYTGDPSHYYMLVNVRIGFDDAAILFLADLGTDLPDCENFSGVVCAFYSQASTTGVGEWYCDYSAATFTVSVPP